MNPPRISIVMNVRNGAAFLRETLDSVFAQTFRDWELVVWDDCSTDSSAAVVAEYADDRVRYFLSPVDTPLGTARNLALRQVRGEWVAFLDQDDIWLPGKLSRQWELAEADHSSHVGLIYGRTVEFFPNGRQRDFDSHHEFASLPEGCLFEEFFLKSCFVAISSAMFRRSALGRVGEIPAEFELISDFYLFVEIARHYEVRAVQDLVCRYRRHAESLSYIGRARLFVEALQLLDRTGGLDPRVAAHARRFFHTAIAITEIGHPRSLLKGVARLARHGSLGYVLSRPFARLRRRIRGRFGHPRWRSPHPPAALPATPLHASIVLSIVVVNWRTPELLRECLNSVYDRMRLSRSDWELTVVDNHSEDGSVDMLRREFPEARLIVNDRNVGFAKANNQAFSVCRGRFILLLNPDVVLLDSAIDRMLEILASRPDAAVLGCRLLNADRTLQRWTAGAPPGPLNVLCHFLFLYRVLPAALLPRPLFLEREPRHDAEVGWVSGACMLLRREALAGRLFDESFFMYGEDLHLCQALSRAGWKVLYTPRVQIVHYGGRSIENQTPEIQLNKLINLRKVFAARHGPASLLWFDSAVSAGFMLRSVAFALAAWTLPGRGYEIRAARSRQFLGEAVRSFGNR